MYIDSCPGCGFKVEKKDRGFFYKGLVTQRHYCKRCTKRLNLVPDAGLDMKRKHPRNYIMVSATPLKELRGEAVLV